MLGFRNMGNTCYMNSILSILLNCPNFITIINTTTNKTGTDIKPRIKSATELLDSFKQLVELKSKISNGQMGVIQPGGILRLVFGYLQHRKVSPLIPMRQNDALECLSVFLDAFEDGSKQKMDENWKSGKVRRDIICKMDNKVVDTKEETQITWNIQLPQRKRTEPEVELKLQECLMNSFDKYSDEIRYKRDEDTSEQDYIIKRSIIETPKLWFLSLARWDMMQNKIMDPVSVPIKMNIKSKQYELRGVVCHMGSSIPSGHYYSVIMSGATAYRIDDDRIHQCPIPFPQIVNRHIYGVMYEQVV